MSPNKKPNIKELRKQARIRLQQQHEEEQRRLDEEEQKERMKHADEDGDEKFRRDNENDKVGQILTKLALECKNRGWNTQFRDS